jgi:limonene-1,2-epoxide hydrolase
VDKLFGLERANARRAIKRLSRCAVPQPPRWRQPGTECTAGIDGTCAVCRTHEKELKAVAVRFEADAMQYAAGGGSGLHEPHVHANIRVSSRQSIEASALTY